MAVAVRQGVAAPPAAAQAVPMIPFVAAAHEHEESMGLRVPVVTPGAAGTDGGPDDVPAYGYLRHLVVEVSGAGGALGGGALNADYPWNIFERLSLLDVNGSPICELDGFALFLANMFGGYVYNQDPRDDEGFVGTINARFGIRIPIEINHFDGLGCISNQNAASSYKLSYRVRPLASLVTGGAPTAPTLTIRAWLEAWSLPNETDLAGRPQEQKPPLHSTSQYWSSNTKVTVAGQNTVQIQRTGNHIRNLIFIARDAAGLRTDTAFPDPVTFSWDGNQIQASLTQYMMNKKALEKVQTNQAAGARRPAGVFILPYAHTELGRNGDGPPNLWLATVQAARLEISGVTAAAGSIQVVTNDIAPVETAASERFVLPSRTGYHPSQAAA